ncbi:MAG: deoxyribodipyrimidine photo-lyase [Rickettsiales bacterium]|nr:deoxyribodipyrimidine photo-lyase [Rickettsiales bacterium]
MKKAICWFRNDLRLGDNEALNYAVKQNCEILFLYVLDESQEIGAASKWFLHKALESLSADLKKRYGATLVVKKGNPQDILQNLCQKYQIDAIFYNRVYEPDVMKRDSNIKSDFKNQGLEVKSFNASLLFEPFDIKNQSGEYFKVFTPFWKACLTKISDLSPTCPRPEKLQLLAVNEAPDDLTLLPTQPNWASGWDKIYDVNEESVHNVVQKFLDNRVNNYKEDRNFPGVDATSKMSPYLHFGLISPKQIYVKSLICEPNKGLDCFLSEIGWREFSYHLLYHFPELSEKNFKEKFDGFQWENNKENLKKWQKGQTGFPLIDAGMRELWHTGWMHNRVRMVVASFLIKNLLIDWRLGQEWFWDCLVDADLAANSASWQWVAGSGADAAPYFRIFNPIMQSEKFDPKGEYIRKWVPEIAHLPDCEIHFPKNRQQYVEPIIDLIFSRNRALTNYKKLS